MGDILNGHRLRIWGPAPAVETTFDGVTYVLDWNAQTAVIAVVNRGPYRNHQHYAAAYGGMHARGLLSLAENLRVTTYLAEQIALWVAPNRCGIGWSAGRDGYRRVRILSLGEEWAWREGRARAGTAPPILPSYDRTKVRCGRCAARVTFIDGQGWSTPAGPACGPAGHDPAAAKGCGNPLHDHTTDVDANGLTVQTLVAMRCNDCGLPAHWDEGIRDYRHDDPDPDTVCFLIQDNTGGSACVPVRGAR